MGRVKDSQIPGFCLREKPMRSWLTLFCLELRSRSVKPIRLRKLSTMPELDLPATKKAPSYKTLGVLPVLLWTRLLALGGRGVGGMGCCPVRPYWKLRLFSGLPKHNSSDD
jgi:hypothetical protein